MKGAIFLYCIGILVMILSIVLGPKHPSESIQTTPNNKTINDESDANDDSTDMTVWSDKDTSARTTHLTLYTVPTNVQYAVVTAANDAYFDALLTLVSSIHKFSDSPVQSIIVYDLGLKKKQLRQLNTLDLVYIRKYKLGDNDFPEMLDPGQHAYKWPFVKDASGFVQYVLWMDAGVMFRRSPKIMFDILVQDEVFLVEDAHTNREWTSFRCREIMNATDEELDAHQLSSGISGFKSDGRYTLMLDDCARFSRIKECVVGDAFYTEAESSRTGIRGHRHDQSISSILAKRYKCPLNALSLFGEFVKENLEKFNSVVFVHRRSFADHQDLRAKSHKLP